MKLSTYPVAALAACLMFFAASGQSAAAPQPAGVRDGQHDFDFNIGTWKSHIRRLAHPLSGDKTSVDMIATVTVRPVWNGRAQLEEIEADGPQGHWQGATLFLYNPEAHQWSQTFFNSAHPVPEPSTVGAFANGRGELYAQDTINGKAVLVRGTWSDIKPNSHRYEEAYSEDGGRSWETAFAARLERIAP